MNTEEIIINLLKEGLTQPEIADRLKAEGVSPNSLSSIEKYLKVIRKRYGASTMFHLGYILGGMKNE